MAWSPLAQSWVTKAGATPADSVPIPPLDGTLETTPEVIAGFTGDFGRLIEQTPMAVLRPGSVQDVVKMVRYARCNDLKIAMNGQAGTPDQLESHSNYGQALVQGGIAIDANSLRTIHSIGADSADVDGGVTWAQLVNEAAAVGKTPPVLTDFLHLTVGGTVSVGGIGGGIQSFGTQADTITKLQVVTGAGNLVTCSATQRAALFNAVLAGAGQCGIIVRATVKLIPLQTNALVFNLFYDDLATYMTDQTTVLDDGRFTYQEGQIVPKPDGSGWRYMMEVASYYTPPNTPDQAALLAGLSDNRPSAVIVDLPYLQWVFRVDPIMGFLKANGFWAEAHPWVSLIVPASKTEAFINQVVAQLAPTDLGVGLAPFYPFKTAKITRPLFALPQPNEPVAFVLSLLRFPFPGFPGIPGMVAQNRTFFDAAVAVGGKRYNIGAVPDLTPADWRRHYAPKFLLFKLAKAIFDPDNVLTPGQGIFPS